MKTHAIVPFLIICALGSTVFCAELKESIIHLSHTRSIKGIGAAYAPLLVSSFYKKNGYRLAWFRAARDFEEARRFLSFLQTMELHGLSPNDYHYKQLAKNLNTLLRKNDSPERTPLLYQTELLLSDAYFLAASHLLFGKVDHIRIDSEWHVKGRRKDISNGLSAALASRTIVPSLNRYVPAEKGYNSLKSALARYRKVEEKGGWSSSERFFNLRTGVKGPKVVHLIRRLALEGYKHTGKKDLFDSSLMKIVSLYQRHHGIPPSGWIDRTTVQKLNIPVVGKISTILANLERWRWLPERLGEQYVLVNIPQFDLRLVKSGKVLLRSRAIVGKAYRRTPVFSGQISFVVINPYWIIPHSIFLLDLYPKYQRGSNFFKKQKIRFFEASQNDVEVPEDEIDWETAIASPDRYIIRQDPGPSNALGKVKIMFPNKFSIYIHDTPTKDLFDQEDRAFSSGCIRIEKAEQLLEILTSKFAGVSPQRLKSTLVAGREVRIDLKRSVPVHIEYWTAWAGEGGLMEFRSDIYNRDSPLIEELLTKPSSRASK